MHIWHTMQQINQISHQQQKFTISNSATKNSPMQTKNSPPLATKIKGSPETPPELGTLSESQPTDIQLIQPHLWHQKLNSPWNTTQADSNLAQVTDTELPLKLNSGTLNLNSAHTNSRSAHANSIKLLLQLTSTISTCHWKRLIQLRMNELPLKFTHSPCSHDTPAGGISIHSQWDGTTPKRVLSLLTTSSALGLAEFSLLCSSSPHTLLEVLFPLSFCFPASTLWIPDFLFSLQTAFLSTVIGLSKFNLSTIRFFYEGNTFM